MFYKKGSFPESVRLYQIVWGWDIISYILQYLVGWENWDGTHACVKYVERGIVYHKIVLRKVPAAHQGNHKNICSEINPVWTLVRLTNRCSRYLRRTHKRETFRCLLLLWHQVRTIDILVVTHENMFVLLSESVSW